MILVSHDRDFLKGLTNRTFEFRNQGIREHLGGIDEFLRKLKVETFREFEQIKKSVATTVAGDDKNDKKEKYLQKRESDKEYKKIQKELKSVEHKIEETELKIREAELLMQMPEFYQNKIVAREVTEKHRQMKLKIEELLEEWEKVHNLFDEIEKNRN